MKSLSLFLCVLFFFASFIHSLKTPPIISSSFTTSVGLTKHGAYSFNETVYSDGENQRARFDEYSGNHQVVIGISISPSNTAVQFSDKGDCSTTCYQGRICPGHSKCNIPWPVVQWFVPLSNASYIGDCSGGSLWSGNWDSQSQVEYCISDSAEPLAMNLYSEGNLYLSVEFNLWDEGVPDPSIYIIPNYCPCMESSESEDSDNKILFFEAFESPNRK
eukprot:TRINITY_DN26316_c0_g1_i1.p1 TRINITY_DN26316_c0_g1~~TRINITY_DN26316_c0_g1_i1.p1  ORF type:complete len:218 (+),score=3.00 TRINITY_DN26316_c0_g1_i1:115-768(+)